PSMRDLATAPTSSRALTSTAEQYIPSLHDALPIFPRKGAEVAEITEKNLRDVLEVRGALEELAVQLACERMDNEKLKELHAAARSEEHTSELQSRFDLVCRPLLEKKNQVTAKRLEG